MSQAAWLRVNRADEALRQEDRYNEMDAIANKINKLVKKGSKGKPQAESDRLMKIVIWAIFEDGLGRCNPRDEQQDTGDREGEEEDEAR